MRPAPGRTWRRLLPAVRAEAFGLALCEFARDGGIGPERRAVPVLDQAGWHASLRLAVLERVHLAFLPPASPELQPAERLWPLLDEPVANRASADLDELEAALAHRHRALEADRRTVKAQTRFRWWPRQRRPRRPR